MELECNEVWGLNGVETLSFTVSLETFEVAHKEQREAVITFVHLTNIFFGLLNKPFLDWFSASTDNNKNIK